MQARSLCYNTRYGRRCAVLQRQPRLRLLLLRAGVRRAGARGPPRVGPDLGVPLRPRASCPWPCSASSTARTSGSRCSRSLRARDGSSGARSSLIEVIRLGTLVASFSPAAELRHAAASRRGVAAACEPVQTLGHGRCCGCCRRFRRLALPARHPRVLRGRRRPGPLQPRDSGRAAGGLGPAARAPRLPRAGDEPVRRLAAVGRPGVCGLRRHRPDLRQAQPRLPVADDQLRRCSCARSASRSNWCARSRRPGSPSTSARRCGRSRPKGASGWRAPTRRASRRRPPRWTRSSGGPNEVEALNAELRGIAGELAALVDMSRILSSTFDFEARWRAMRSDRSSTASSGPAARWSSCAGPTAVTSCCGRTAGRRRRCRVMPATGHRTVRARRRGVGTGGAGMDGQVVVLDPRALDEAKAIPLTRRAAREQGPDFGSIGAVVGRTRKNRWGRMSCGC